MTVDYNDFFNIDQSSINKVLSKGLSKGGDYCDLYFEYSTSDTLLLRDTKVNNCNSDIDFGTGIRVLSKEKTGFAFAETTDIKTLITAAANAAEIASLDTSIVEIPTNFKTQHFTNHYPILDRWKNHGIAERQKILENIDQSIRESSELVTKVTGKISTTNTKIMFYNSLGETFCDEIPLTSVILSCVMEKGSKRESYITSRSFRMEYEMITQELLDEMKDELIKGCSRLFVSSQPKAGTMPVVMAAGSSGIFLHEAIGHAFEADFIRKKTSIFSDKLGQKICRDDINIVDDGTLMHNRGAMNFDDEGVLSQKTYMVKDGVLNSFLHDRISAKHFNTAPTGNGRRESFRYYPIPRMRATYMENGNSSEEDIIKSVDYGIYVDNFSNGQVQIGAGDFTFFVKTGYMIENGKLTKPIKDTNIIGNGPKALADVLACANNSKIDNGTWTCGKDQSVAVSQGMPTILIKSLNVGGVNG
ncbi:MAG: TldD/PmbA family protein [Bacteroidales bacterium]